MMLFIRSIRLETKIKAPAHHVCVGCFMYMLNANPTDGEMHQHTPKQKSPPEYIRVEHAAHFVAHKKELYVPLRRVRNMQPKEVRDVFNKVKMGNV